jgi:serine protease Do
MIAETPIGQTIDISYIRSGKTLTTQITVAKQEKSVASNTKNASGRVVMEKLGLSLMDLDDAMRKYYGMSNVPYGAFIDDADSRYDGTLRRGDIIVEIDQQSIHNVNDFVQKFDKLTNDGVNPILLKINRQGVHLYVAVRVN